MVDPVQGEVYGTERDTFVSEDRGLDPRRADDEGLEVVAERFEEDVAGTGEAAPGGVPQSASCSQAALTIRAASSVDGGSGCGCCWRGRLTASKGLTAIHPHRSAALSAVLDECSSLAPPPTDPQLGVELLERAGTKLR